jgi:hypothetical protein
VAVELPTGPSGARRRLRRGGYRTRAEAQQALTGLRRPHPHRPTPGTADHRAVAAALAGHPVPCQKLDARR